MGIINKLLGDSPRRHYRRRGYHVFRDVIPAEQVDALAHLARSMMPAYEGELLRQSGRAEANDFFPGTSLIRNPPFNLHLPLSTEVQPLTAAIQELITTPALAARIADLDGAQHHYVNQTLLFFAAQTTAPHIDSWAVDTVPHGGAHTLWIPLQDMDHQSGVPAVVPWPVGKLISEREFGLSTDAPHADRYERYQAALATKLLEDTPEIVTAFARRGDVLVWSSLTPHFTLPSQPFPQRSSIDAGAPMASRRQMGELHSPAGQISRRAHARGHRLLLVLRAGDDPSAIRHWRDLAAAVLVEPADQLGLTCRALAELDRKIRQRAAVIVERLTWVRSLRFLAQLEERRFRLYLGHHRHCLRRG
jgi:hypothetical protein